MPQIEHFTKELNLPGPIARYLRAVNTGAKEEFPASFDDAVVVDVNRELRGLGAITAWAGADITGAAKGIGAGIAKAMAGAGASVVVNFATDRPGAERVVADIKAAGGKAFGI